MYVSTCVRILYMYVCIHHIHIYHEYEGKSEKQHKTIKK